MRPRDPDALTAREREVLELIRLGLTNDEIARGLDITLDGAKYHVSQILSKLGVATREEAAAWRGEERRARGRWPLWARIASAATMVGALAGMALLTWGVVRTEGNRSSDQLRVAESPDLPPGDPLSITDAFCIDAIDVDPAFEGEMKKVIESTISDLVQAINSWNERYADTVIDFGCPYPPVDYTKDPHGRLVDEESYYDAYIYILPKETLASYFNPEEFKRSAASGVRLTSEEYTCSGDSCAQTSYGLYLTPEDLSNPDLFVNDLCWAIGAGMPEYTDWPPNVCNEYQQSSTP